MAPKKKKYANRATPYISFRALRKQNEHQSPADTGKVIRDHQTSNNTPATSEMTADTVLFICIALLFPLSSYPFLAFLIFYRHSAIHSVFHNPFCLPLTSSGSRKDDLPASSKNCAQSASTKPATMVPASYQAHGA